MKEEIIDFNDPIIEYNFHTHTKRCGHAVGEDYEYVEAAIKKGYKIVGISDHCPYKELSLPQERMEWEEFSDYLETLQKLKEHYKDKIDIYIGLECEYYDYHLQQLKELKKKVDYLILGQHHYIDGKTTKPYLTEQEIIKMIDDMEAGVREELFLYIAHPDYFLREGHVWDELAVETTHKLCKISIKYDIPLELNHKYFKKLKDRSSDAWKSILNFWNIVKEYNCKVCVGIDAHDPESFFDKTNDEEAVIDILKLNIVPTEEILRRIKDKR